VYLVFRLFAGLDAKIEVKAMRLFAGLAQQA